MTINRWLRTGSRVCEQQGEQSIKILILDNFQMLSGMPYLLQMLIRFISKTESENRGKIFFVSRDPIPEELLDLFWKNRLYLITAKELLFSQKDIGKFYHAAAVKLSVKETFYYTGGLPGAVNALVQLERNSSGPKKKSIKDLVQSYEYVTYIQKVLLHPLKAEEIMLLENISGLPWVTESLYNKLYANRYTLDMNSVVKLQNRGYLNLFLSDNRWKINHLYRSALSYKDTSDHYLILKNAAAWYEENGCIEESLYCNWQISNVLEWKNCIIRHYDSVSYKYLCDLCNDSEMLSAFMDQQPVADNSEEDTFLYIKGVLQYIKGDFTGLDSVRSAIVNMHIDTPQRAELYLNLLFLSSRVSLDEWLKELQKYHRLFPNAKFRLFHALGTGVTCLCAARDLSSLFGCSKKDENRKKRIWLDCLSREACILYYFAHIDYLIETIRTARINETERKLLTDKTLPAEFKCFQYYLLLKLQGSSAENDTNDFYLQFQDNEILNEISDPEMIETLLAFKSIYSQKYTDQSEIVEWVYRLEQDGSGIISPSVNEKNYILKFLMGKGYIITGQYNKAKKIMQSVVDYTKKYARDRYMAEGKFALAVILESEKQKGHALRDCIESFVINGDSRYVECYTVYGTLGLSVLKDYNDWLKNNDPAGWSRKKKYNYGSVVQMPFPEYLDVVIRKAGRKSKGKKAVESYERLTLSENIILHDIVEGLSNAEIGDQRGLSITTVKSHIYHLYKSLG